MKLIKKSFIGLISLFVLLAVGLGLRQAFHSSLFLVQNLEIKTSLTFPPLPESAIKQSLNIPLGKISLFDLDLKGIEQKLMISDLIREVKLQKKLLHTLSIEIVFREPKAIFQTPKGGLSYVDEEGKTFGFVNLLKVSDLPLLSGFSSQSSDRIRGALRIITLWEKSSLKNFSQISSIIWDIDRGYRVLISYEFIAKVSPSHLKTRSVVESGSQVVQARAMVDLGQEIDSDFDSQLSRLSNVFRYLKGNSIGVRQIWADAGKKIVVKTVRGS
jgi:POTRA domain, FtsQ-type